jgi:4-hydroxybenzoate polyprenyltransferase
MVIAMRSAGPDRGRPVALVSLGRACHPEPTVAVTAVATALAAASGRSVLGVVAVATAVLSGQLSVGWHNDWLDAERDLEGGRSDKPVARGSIGRRTVGAAAGTALAACVPLSLLSGWRAGAAHVVAVLLAWAYNARLKSTVWSWVPYAVSFALLVAFVSLGRPGTPWPPWWSLLAAALLGVGAHLANVVPDLDDDVAGGVRGLPHRLGPTRCVGGASGLLLAASAVVAFGPGHPGLTAIGLAVAALLVGAGVVAWRRGAPTVLFRASLLVAAVDVAMLVSRGHQI